MKIADVSIKYNISKDTLRWYEKVGIITDIPRNANGVRDYSEENCQLIESIICMRKAGLSIDGLREYFRLYKEGDSTLDERLKLLLEQKQILQDNIDELIRTVEKLNRKIKMCEEAITKRNNEKR